MNRRIFFPLGLCIFLSACGSSDSPGVATTESACNDFAGFSVSADDIGLPTAGVTLDTTFRFTPSVAYCEVVGEIFPVDSTAPSINFQINLPPDWNGNGLQFAGSGVFGGELSSGTGPIGSSTSTQNPTPLAQGYATWGSDSGHQSPDGSFMLNDEALRNFGGEHIKKTNDVAIAVVNAFYGATPEKVYIQGDEQGGRAALIAAQRWPTDYDGVIAVNPLTTIVGQHIAATNAEQILAQPNIGLTNTETALISNTILNSCDGLDGTFDGVVQNISACEETGEIEVLRCNFLVLDQEACLVDTQADAVNTIAAPFSTPPLIDNILSVSGWSLVASDLSLLFNPDAPFFSPSITATPTIRFGILRDSLASTTSFTTAGNEARITELSNIIDASANVAEFTNSGGKILLLHETISDTSAFGNTVNWYERALALPEIQSASTSISLNLVSQVDADDLFGLLSALDRWSVTGTAPTNLVSNSVQITP